ncbi:hypothetical protein WAI453_013598 [Rhynchosporium graminicola]|uniref:DUF7704 domain-containing protein n=1 Tax=Rhynchosporium graminicola TaxID=2792576 RepID=A0A1E1LSA0_9HELO|nr:uncharacterized protein RCO7_15240 [Rhynchosporium commune]
MASSAPTTIKHISLLYRIYFLYIEPIFALFGAYLAVFDPSTFLIGTLPGTVSRTLTSTTPSNTIPEIPVSPLLQMQLINVGALYILIAFAMGLALRFTRQKNVWFAVLTGMACSDIGHLYAVWLMDPARMAALGAWSWEEWVNYGLLFGGLFLRVSFMMGIGNRW